MAEILRTRDCILFKTGDITTVAVSDAMIASGWPGGQGVQWAATPSTERLVTYSAGLVAGFLIWGSDEAADQHVATTNQFTTYRYAVLAAGGNLLSTSTYERYTYASRLLGGPYVPLVYTANAALYLSLRGYWTLEDEPSLSGGPIPAEGAAVVAQIPKASNNYFLGLQTTI